VWRIRDVYPGSRIRLFSIPDPGSELSPSRIRVPDPHQRIYYFNPKKSKKRFLSSKKYDPGCSSRIPVLDADFLPSRIPDPGSRGQKGTQSRIRIRNTEKIVFLCCLEGSRTKIAGSGSGSIGQSADPDPYQNVTDLQHCFPPLSHPYGTYLK
jgi:hypothetical protein